MKKIINLLPCILVISNIAGEAVSISAGPIMSDVHAQTVCPGVCQRAGGKFTKHWWTPVSSWGKDSICQCDVTKATTQVVPTSKGLGPYKPKTAPQQIEYPASKQIEYPAEKQAEYPTEKQLEESKELVLYNPKTAPQEIEYPARKQIEGSKELARQNPKQVTEESFSHFISPEELD